MKIELTLRSVARSLSIALATLIVILAVGEGLPPLFTMSVAALESWLLLLALVGLLAAWRSELWGGIAGLVGIGGFYFTDFAASGFRRFPGGWIFPILALVPVIFLSAWWRHRAMNQKKAAFAHPPNERL